MIIEENQPCLYYSITHRSILSLTAPEGFQLIKLLQGITWSGPFTYSVRSLSPSIPFFSLTTRVTSNFNAGYSLSLSQCYLRLSCICISVYITTLLQSNTTDTQSAHCTTTFLLPLHSTTAKIPRLGGRYSWTAWDQALHCQRHSCVMTTVHLYVLWEQNRFSDAR